ncbi:hypothetical protein [Sabulicella glaciei]|uniref:Uncharacterized protein n=1 Tax=Sabulicella glaciei TaxID=2984948 RepID=A0ABT3P1S5_9PROT|nr:hypothetical protein [Roseococcus sp. MDT2-1-1]MCW8087699.1 hypothetical protein [Roseococcus sp. MDT2-1-1]
MKSIELPAFARRDGLRPHHLAGLAPDVCADRHALRFEERDAAGLPCGVLTMSGSGRYGFGAGGRRGLTVLGDTPGVTRLLLASGAYAALCAHALEAGPGTVCASPGGSWTARAEAALEALIRTRGLWQVTVAQPPGEAGERFAQATTGILRMGGLGLFVAHEVRRLPADFPTLMARRAASMEVA